MPIMNTPANLTKVARIARLSRLSANRPTRLYATTPVRGHGECDDHVIKKLFGSSRTTSNFDAMFQDASGRDTMVQMLQDPNVVDVTFDIGKHVTVHYRGQEPPVPLPSDVLTKSHVHELWNALDTHGDHDRAGIKGSANRWSCLRNFDGEVAGVTMRVSRPLDVHTTLHNDLKGYLALGNSTILFGPPGSGKTTMLRCIAQYLNDHVARRVIVIDESGELGGFDDVANGIGGARRACVHPGTTYHETIRRAIRNHTPHVIIIDELMTHDDVVGAMAAASRGVQLIATCHANTIRDMIHNPLISDLVGGQQHAAVTDVNASKTGGKFISARKTPPTFRGAYSIPDGFLYPNLSHTIDAIMSS